MTKLWPNNVHVTKVASGLWPILCQLMVILSKLVDMDFKFVLPSIYINFDIQTQVSHSILKNTPEMTKMAISQNPILPKCHPPKILLLLHFSMNLTEIFRMNVNTGFWILGSTFFGSLNQKSATISMSGLSIWKKRF